MTGLLNPKWSECHSCFEMWFFVRRPRVWPSGNTFSFAQNKFLGEAHVAAAHQVKSLGNKRVPRLYRSMCQLNHTYTWERAWITSLLQQQAACFYAIEFPMGACFAGESYGVPCLLHSTADRIPKSAPSSAIQGKITPNKDYGDSTGHTKQPGLLWGMGYVGRALR